MSYVRQVVVFDASDVATESAFWAGMYGGRVIDEDPNFHCVIDRDGNWVIGVQHAPDHTPPEWPDGSPQQVHLDLHATDPEASHRIALGLGARVLRDGDPQAQPDEGYRVYADPAGHPFCIGWGHPSAAQLAEFLTAHPPS